MSAVFAVFFILYFCLCIFLHGLFLTKNRGKNMQLTLIKNNDDAQIVSYKLARIVFAETEAKSLPLIEAMTSMINNVHIKYGKTFDAISKDSDLFECLNTKSERNEKLNIDANDRKFQLCLRTVKTMMRGNLPDSVFGATKFHHTNIIPDWAMARGYISECEDILFYL